MRCWTFQFSVFYVVLLRYGTIRYVTVRYTAFDQFFFLFFTNSSTDPSNFFTHSLTPSFPFGFSFTAFSVSFYPSKIFVDSRAFSEIWNNGRRLLIFFAVWFFCVQFCHKVEKWQISKIFSYTYVLDLRAHTKEWRLNVSVQKFIFLVCNHILN